MTDLIGGHDNTLESRKDVVDTPFERLTDPGLMIGRTRCIHAGQEDVGVIIVRCRCLPRETDNGIIRTFGGGGLLVVVPLPAPLPALSVDFNGLKNEKKDEKKEEIFREKW